MGVPRVSVSVAVTNYNGEGYLDECLTAVKRQTLAPEEIFVVDNASTDGSLKLLRERHPDVVVIEMAENRGPGAARNEAIRKARHRLLLSIDNDAVLDEACLATLVDVKSSRPEAVLLEPRAVYHADRNRVHYDGGNLNYIGIVSLRNQGRRLATIEDEGSAVEIDAAMAVALLIDRDVIEDDDLYDEAYHFYFEDIDFSYRLRLKGNTVLLVPAALVYHREGTAGLSYRKERGYPQRRAYFFTRNRWRFAIKVLRLRSFVLGFPAIVVYEASYLLFIALKGHLMSYGKALAVLFCERKEMLSSRRRIQSARRVSDRVLLTGRRLTFVSTDDNRVATRALDRALNACLFFWWRVIRSLIK